MDTQTATNELTAPLPPVAPRRPSQRTLHGITVVDDYAWLKDANWQEVLRNPALLDPDIRAYLEAENRYTEAFLGPAAGAAEDAGRRDARPHQGRRFERAAARRAVRLSLEVPRRRPARIDRAHAARRRRGPGRCSTATPWPRACRTSISAARAIRPTTASKPGAPTSAARSSSPSACASWQTGADLPDVIEQTSGSVVWGLDSTFFYYVRLDDNHRPLHIYRHRLGTPQSDDVLVYEEKDNGWFARIEESASGRFCIVATGNQETSERWLIDLADADADAAPGGVARDRRALQRRRPRRRALHPHQPGRRHRLSHRHGAACDARPRQLARADPAPARHLHHQRVALCRTSGAAGARERAGLDRDPRPCRRRPSTSSPSRRRPTRSMSSKATSSTPRGCASPIRR